MAGPTDPEICCRVSVSLAGVTMGRVGALIIEH